MSERSVRPGAAGPATSESVVKRPVFLGSAVGVLLIAGWALAAPTRAAETIGVLVGWAAEWFGWFYILLATAVLVFVVFLGASRYGRIRLGPEHSKPQYSTFAWASMLFAAGIGTDLMFFAVAEPVTQLLAPPVGEAGTAQAAGDATMWTLFHYGISGWGMYALMGMALAYFAYRMNMPLAIRSALYPIFGKRVHGPIGHGVDMAAVLGTIFGVATSLGIGVVQLNYGLSVLFGIPEGRGAQIGLIALAVAMATVSAVSGVDRGIRLLSQVNVLLAVGLAAFVLLLGNTSFLLNALVSDVGRFVSRFPGLSLETFAHDGAGEWLSGWTLFFWAWWIAWSAFVGLFLARISRGRTIRQFVAGTLIIPFSYIVMWVSIFGNSALDRVRGGDAAFGELAMNTPERGFYTLLMEYPAFPFVAAIATFVGLLFYVTSADSGALVMSNLCSDLKSPEADGSARLRIFWAVATGLLTAAMLQVDEGLGVTALQNATIVMGLPFAFVMVLVMVGLHRALRAETRAAAGTFQYLPGRLGRPRLAALPGQGPAQEYLDEVALPALRAVAEEVRSQGVEAHADWADAGPGERAVELHVAVAGDEPFRYRIERRDAPLPGQAFRSATEGPTYPRLEVHLSGEGQGYDVRGFTHSQLVDDAFDQYTRHVQSLRVGQLSG
ncbi:choline/glycine/proline betaine transport protein [Kineococcus xinjiangensis]|uniref:Choline/glycine/proline betaine transport protein n=1 Tax=Kineococcus xinjiangensis TaxID=512762 RepID=A0A2S6IVT8_9ACTN|nr:choline BCCT transporter BetT [Kineococcus xinjiangensis]PPK98350.1 choline/glycine/proline betaine transport protein [Kineococcus xinjiangensis]